MAKRAWIQRLPDAEKNDWLSRLIANEPPSSLRGALLQRFRRDQPLPAPSPDSRPRRTVAELLELASMRTETRRREEAEQATRARNQNLDDLASREEAIWVEVDTLFASRKPSGYDRAVAMLTDLRELAQREQRLASFTSRLRELRARHATKPSVIRRLDIAGL